MHRLLRTSLPFFVRCVRLLQLLNHSQTQRRSRRQNGSTELQETEQNVQSDLFR